MTETNKTMRNLNNKDLLTLMRIVKKGNVKKKLAEMNIPRNEKGEIELSEEQFGVMMILEIVEAIPDAEKDIFKFLADVAGVSTKEMEEDEFDLLLSVVEHLKNQDKMISFFKLALNSLTTQS